MPTGYPAAVGSPKRSELFIPEFFSGKIIENLYITTVFGEIANTDYEGEIKKMGDMVHIPYMPVAKIYDYARGQVLAIDTIKTNETTLEINNGHYFNAMLERVEELQSKFGAERLKLYAEDAARRLAIQIDSNVLNSVYADANADNRGTTAGKISNNINLGTTGAPVGIDKFNVLDKITEIAQVLNEQNAYAEERALVVPEWFYTALMKSDLKNASVSSNNGEVFKNGKVFNDLLGFKIFKSNNYIPVVDGVLNAYHVIAVQKRGLSFAAQVQPGTTQMLDSEHFFGKIIRGMTIYGWKTTKSELLADLYCYQA